MNLPRGPISSDEDKRLRQMAARRSSALFGLAFAVASALLSLLAIVVVVSGTQHAKTLPTTPRPNLGPGFSEAVTQSIGSFLFSAVLAAAAVLALVVALVHSQQRKRTALFALPLGLYVLAIATHKLWLAG